VGEKYNVCEGGGNIVFGQLYTPLQVTEFYSIEEKDKGTDANVSSQVTEFYVIDE
jgi:hypothetical protein